MSIDTQLMEKAGLHPYERILCGNMANGNRFETYVIPGESGTGSIILNGATALLGKPGDLLTIMSFTYVEEDLAHQWQPRVIVLEKNNGIINERGV